MATRMDMEALFKEADVDGSNSLTLTELHCAMKRCGYVGDEKTVKEFFDKADSSGDDKISFSEYMTAMNKAPPQLHRAALMRRLFSRFDKDSNGTLNRKELQNATAMLGDRFSAEDIDVLMEILDKDKSDTVNLEEFIQAFMNRRR